jgi:ACS family pantothenate transporter-like MFS transporter
MTIDKDTATVESKTLPQPQSTELSPERSLPEKKKQPLKRRIREILWDSFDRTPEERWFVHKIDFFILTWASLSYFSKNLNTNNISKSIQTYPALQELMSATLTRHR